MTETLLSLIPDAAGHPLLGASYAFYPGTPSATSSATNQVVCSDLIDSSGAITGTNWHYYCYASVTAAVISGQSRRVQNVDLTTGTLTMNRAFTRVTDASDLFWLLRNFSRNDWRDFANAALREMKRRVIRTTPGLGSGILRYSPPTGVVRPEDVIDIGVRSYPEVTTDGQPEPLRWWEWEDNDGTLILVTDRTVDVTQELVFKVLRPFATAGQNVFTTDTDTTTAPRDWLVAEMVARALLALWSMAEESDKPNFLPRLQAAGTLCAGFRAHYTPTPPRRLMASSGTF